MCIGQPTPSAPKSQICWQAWRVWLLFRIPADLALPGIPIETVQRLGLALLATQDNSIDSQPDADTSQGMLWLQQELKRQEIDTLNLHKSNTPTNLIELLDVVYQRRILSTKTRIESHTPLSAATATDLFLLLEQKNQLKEQSEENRNKIKDSCIASPLFERSTCAQSWI